MTPGKIPAYTRYLPEYLTPLGYRSYHTGKWNMKYVTGEAGVGFPNQTPATTAPPARTARAQHVD